MKLDISFFSILILLIILITAGVQAFSVENVDILVGESGDADVVMNYRLNPVERGVYSLVKTTLDTKKVVKERLENTFYKEVSVGRIGSDEISFRVYEFAEVEDNSYTILPFDYKWAVDLFSEDLMWIKDALSIDYSPEMTTIEFADGHCEIFEDLEVIPFIEYTIPE
jgi:uncharacterized protein YciU (UPF0263 family)